MKFNVYSMRDKYTGFMDPTLGVNDESAIRNFSYALGSNLMFNRFASDYDLYCIGSFDSDEGILEPFVVPRFVFSGSNAYRMYLRSVEDAEV